MNNFANSLLTVCLVAILQLPAGAQSIVRIVDGDTLIMHVCDSDVRVRLARVDAPEKLQPYGSESTGFLHDLLKQGRIHVYPLGKDMYGRMLADLTVTTAAGFTYDVGEEMVGSGHAWVYRRTASQRLLALENVAKLHRRGLWKYGSPVNPADWRKQRSTD